VLERIARRLRVDASGCWLWQGARNSQGYGCIRIGGRSGRTVSVHRIVAESRFGVIPADRMVCHTFDVRACANPSHLYLGTAVDNARDMIARGRDVNVLATRNAQKTHCTKGHPYAGANLMIVGSGDRRCRICQRAQQRQSALTRRARSASAHGGVA
jgi:hypothetical protein